MSADSYAYCPKCQPEGKREGERQEFREDYEQGVMPDGEYFVSYSGQCRVCGFRHEFKHSQDLSN